MIKELDSKKYKLKEEQLRKRDLLSINLEKKCKEIILLCEKMERWIKARTSRFEKRSTLAKIAIKAQGQIKKKERQKALVQHALFILVSDLNCCVKLDAFYCLITPGISLCAPTSTAIRAHLHFTLISLLRDLVAMQSAGIWLNWRNATAMSFLDTSPNAHYFHASF